ncbi:hypothetical protein LCGC14_0447590 [marine sediment metagenome]|uniref:Uncharacterized protein n=1 Tax=marine sediment metagenome TaxID=412755 RepID=A0A0F9SPE9_9ZZZZ|nr:hypothetical protein [Candidatus Aminicenantes bacterium]HEB35707.1 hypothetical protein [Candidatus Aminicenantes bacterium]
MKNRIIVGTILFAFLLSGTVFAQEKKQKVEAPQLTVEQKWKRAMSNLNAIFIASIAYAKSQGKSPSHYGKYMGELFATSWEGVKGVTDFIEAMHWNWQMWEDFQIEVLEESENFYKAKIKGIGEKYITEGSEAGVTLNEYYDCWEQLMMPITNYLGLEYKQKIEGDWIVFTVKEKK